MNNNKSIHPRWGDNNWHYYIPCDVEKLVIGTMPPKRFCDGNILDNDINFFYGSSNNDFWHVLGGVYNNNVYDNSLYVYNDGKLDKDETIYLRKEFLKNNKIGMVDIVEECIHNDGLSDDKSLLYIKNIDLISILNKIGNHSLKLICTSEYARNLLCIYYATSIEYDKNDSKHCFITINNINYELFVLYSPTKRVMNRLVKNDVKLIKNYSVLFK